MSSAQGRFTSPDVPLLDQREDDPQSWNLYSYGRNNPLRYTDPTGNCTVDGEQHFGSCIFHTLGFYQTKKEQAAAAQKEADEDRTAMAQWHGFSINGQTPADIAKNGTNQQVVGAYKSGMGFLTGVAMQSLSPCAPGVACGVIPIGPVGAEIEGVEAGAQSEITNITRGGSVVNIRTNVTVDEFGKNLESNGFAKSAAKDGTPQYTKGNTQYTVYPKSTSTGETTAQVKVNGVVVEKIRLK